MASARSMLQRLPDFIALRDALLGKRGSRWGSVGGWFGPGEAVVARAPARLDAMGGIADYSGSLVCEGTLAQATFAAVQRRTDKKLVIHSAGAESHGLVSPVEWSLDAFYQSGKPKEYEQVRQELAADRATAWAAYVAGCFHALLREGRVRQFPHGATIGILSDVPFGAGISSSAALEVATMTAVLSLYGIALEGLDLAALCQVVENRVVGAPCGIMDQVTSALGEKDALTLLRCQPCSLEGEVRLADDIELIGINSNVKHSVGGSAYTDTRVGAFMGLTILLHHLRKAGRIGEAEDPFNGYLCNSSPEEYQVAWRGLLPDRIRGDEFLRRYGDTPDSVTTVDPKRTYKVRSRAEHPIYENARVERFVRDLNAYRLTGREEFLVEAGRQMYASHWSYSNRCGMGARETDVIVDEVRKLGARNGLYGAKITGGGSGGTVAILCRRGSGEALERVLSSYRGQTGYEPDLFRGSSPGALSAGAAVVAKVR